MSAEQETAMYDQNLPEWWEEIRSIMADHGYNIGQITIEGSPIAGMPSRMNFHSESKSEPGYSPHQRAVLDSFTKKHDIYAERAAVYKDNYKVVGRVMQALFPDGAPPLKQATDYDRWHIFELMIVKLTRYTNNWFMPHKDSIDDLGVYAAILGALDDEFYQRIEQNIADEQEMIKHVQRLKDAVRGSGLFMTSRDEDNEAKMYAEEDHITRVMAEDRKPSAQNEAWPFPRVTDSFKDGEE